jgi:hypothetical protein
MSGSPKLLIVAVAMTVAAPPANEPPRFIDHTAAAGIEFRHISGAFGDKWMPESLGAGVALFDADGDGWTDILFVQGMSWPGHETAVPAELREATMQLYRNRGDRTFENLTRGSGLEVPLYGFGAAPADYDGDGDTDLLVTAYGANRMFENAGDGTFADVTEASGLGHPGWGTSAAWLDYDLDGDLDVYVANYVKWTSDNDIWCSLDGTNKSYCTPESYEGEPSVLYRNEGDGTFVDVSVEARVFVPGGKSLGVTVADFNADGRPDFAVANDTEPNFLFENAGDGTFAEVGLLSGMAFDSTGRARAGMGIDTADLTNTGRLALAIGNFSKEMIGLFEQGPGGLFVDIAGRAGVGRSSFPFLTFGLFFFDHDLDGWLDFFAVNGHLEDRIAEVEASIDYEQRPLLYLNRRDGTLQEVGERAGDSMTRAIVGRGAAFADFDHDGDLDVVMTSNDGPAYLLLSTTRDLQDPPHVVRITLRDVGANTAAIGAAVTVRTGEWQQVQLVRAGSSYASHSERTLTFGLGAGKLVDTVEIAWPDGERQRLEGTALADAVDHELFIRRSGIEARRSLESTAFPAASGVR